MVNLNYFPWGKFYSKSEIDDLLLSYLLVDGTRAMQGDLKPSASDTFNLGSASYPWHGIYVKNILAPYKETALKCDVHLLPGLNLGQNLGSAGAWWAQLFVRDVNLRDTGPTGAYHVVLIGYHNFLSVRNYNDTDYAGLLAKVIQCYDLSVKRTLDCDDIDLPASSVSGLSAVIPVTVGGATKYIPVYDSYSS